jgi:hypothetical protein
MNPITKELVASFHKALHIACGLPALPPSMGDERAWWEFLQEMAPLSEDESGPFSIADIEGAIREMRRERNDGKAGWALRPSTILRNPESFRDMVLLFRTNRRERRLKERRATITGKPVSDTPAEPSVSPEEFSQGFAELRKNLRGGAK